MNNQTNSEKLLEYYRKHLPTSAMALAYLFEKGTSTVSDMNADEYAEQVKAKFDEMESNGNVFLMTFEVAVKMLDIAKELAKYSVMDIITVLANEISGKTPLRRFIDEEVPYRLVNMLGVARKDIDEDMVFIFAEALENNSDIMFDYDAIDDFLRGQLKELGAETSED